MSEKFVHSVENLFQIDRELRKAELGNDKHLARVKLVEGLKESCFLMREMLESPGLEKANYDPETMQYFNELKAQNRLDDFLDIERRCLSFTGLGAPTIETIVRALRHTIDVMIERKGSLDVSWRSSLGELSGLVCDSASSVARDLSRLPLMRRAFLASGGSIVTMLNLFPDPALGIPLQVLAGSVSLGVWFIGYAAKGIFDRWADRAW
jgi:hypothetical protein